MSVTSPAGGIRTVPTSKGSGQEACVQGWVRGWAHSKPSTNSSCNGETARALPLTEGCALLSLVYLEVPANATMKEEKRLKH